MRTAKIIFALGLVLTGLGLSACNTTEGFGKDVKNTGETIQDSAREAK
jgi:predicted small secreted protein